jgi:hypothetical protein
MATEAELIAQAARTEVPRMPTVEAALAWAAQHDYSGAERAANQYGLFTGRVMYCDQPYYNAFTWRDETEDEHESRMAALAEAHSEALTC